MPNHGDDGGRGPARAGTGRLGPHRVELAGEGGATVLARAVCFAHHAELAPYAAQLRLGDRARGELRLVEESTGETVARLDLARPPRRWRRRAGKAP